MLYRLTIWFANNFPWLILSHLICSAATAVHCVTNKKEKEKPAWILIILGTLHIGWIAYWFNRKQQRYLLPEVEPSYTPPPQTPEGIAAAIASELAKEKKERRS